MLRYRPGGFEVGGDSIDLFIQGVVPGINQIKASVCLIKGGQVSTQDKPIPQLNPPTPDMCLSVNPMSLQIGRDCIDLAILRAELEVGQIKTFINLAAKLPNFTAKGLMPLNDQIELVLKILGKHRPRESSWFRSG